MTIPSANPSGIPSYRLHKARGAAVVTINGRDHYLGRFGTPESRAEYDRLIAEWLVSGRRCPGRADPDRLTVAELILAYWQHAKVYYRKNGKPTKTLSNLRVVLRRLRLLYGHTAVADFSPLAMKAVRQKMISEGLSRQTVNDYAQYIKGCFRWGVSEGLVRPEVLTGLESVRGLRRGRSEAKETEPVRPVADEIVEATLPYLSSVVADMVRIQRLTGMRPGELCQMTTASVDTSGKVWLYRPEHHKTEHHGHERVIPLGPRAQQILRGYLRTELERPIFSPADALAERKERMRAERQTQVSQSQQRRDARRAAKAARRKRPPKDHYTTDSYRRAIIRAGERAGVPAWFPNQLRHTKATELRKQFGLDGAGAILGHSLLETTQVYAERSRELAEDIALRTG